MEDAELVALAREGDREAFGVLAERHFGTVWSVALAITKAPADAEDVCQEALVRAWRRLDGLRDVERFRTWLARVARSVALNHVDARSRGWRRREPLGVHEARGPSPLDDVLTDELGQRLLAAAGELTETQREVLLLYDLEGFAHREVADALDISAVASRRHLSDARRRMRELLAEHRPELRDHG